MDAPKCKLCGERHYGLCAVKRASVREPDHRDAEIAQLKAKIADLEARLAPKPAGSRAAYMRDYRAKTKAS